MLPDIIVTLNLIPRVRRQKISVSSGISEGQVGVVSYEGSTYDHNGEPEVYLPNAILRGRVFSNPFRRAQTRVIKEIPQRPGLITVVARERLAGISLTEQDAATATFILPIHIDDPMVLLSFMNLPDDSDGNILKQIGEDLQHRVDAAIRTKLNEIYTSYALHLWSDPDIQNVAARVFEQLNPELLTWGLRIGTENDVRRILIFREYPQRLHEFVLEFKDAESYILQAPREMRQQLLTQLNLQPDDLPRMKSIAETYGGGMGLFTVIDEHRGEIDLFTTWLKSPERASLVGATFLQEIYGTNATQGYSRQEVEFARRILAVAFRHPMLGIGEHGDLDYQQQPDEVREYFDQTKQGG